MEQLPIWAQLGMSGVFLFLLMTVYNDGKRDRKEMLDMLHSAYERIKTIEEATTGKLELTSLRPPRDTAPK